MQQSGMVGRENRRSNMKTLIAALVGQCKNPKVVAAALLAAGVVGGWAMSTTITTNATAFEDLARIEAPREKLPLEASKPSLIGSYVVTGTDSDGKRYAGPGIVGIALAPSGALELEWDNGKQVGVGEVIGNVLAVACLTKGRTAILLMTINPDGSLSGKWSRRTDRGYKGTETWKKV
jgi:hypothetical protein